MVTSGVRIGVTAMTIKGAKEDDMKLIASLINRVADNIGNEEVMKEIKEEAQSIALKFPLYDGEL